MLFKHNLPSSDICLQSSQVSDHALAHEDQRHVYKLPAQPIRTYADVIEKKKQPFVKKTLQIFPGSRVLSEEESKDIFRLSVSGSYREERLRSETASEHKHLDKGKDRKNSKRKRKNRDCHPDQLPFEFLSSKGGAI